MIHRSAVSVPGALSRALSLGLVLALAGCADIYSRRETIGFSAGDAIAANKALQIIDPWDPRAGWTGIRQDGNRAVAAVDAYRGGTQPVAGEAASPIETGQVITE